jgi:hypothetical protein
MPFSLPAPCHSLSLPAGQLSRAIKASSKLLSRLDYFALQDSIANKILTVLRLNSGQPYALGSLIQGLAVRGQASSVNQDVCRVLVATNVVDEVDSNTSWTLVIKVASQTQRSQVSFEFLFEQWGRLTTPGISGGMRTQQDQVVVGTRSHL